MSGGRIALVVVGALLALLGLGLATGGGALLWAQGTQRDADGFFTSSTERYASGGYAVTSQEIDLGTAGEAGWATDVGDLARVRIRGLDAGTGQPLFIGIGPRDAVETYLSGVPASEVADVHLDPFRVDYTDRPGTRAPAPPASQGFWVARSAGTGRQTLEWDVRGGTWMLVVMNAGAARGVVADLSFGVKVDVLEPIAIGLLVAGLLLLAGGVTMLVFGLRGAARGPAPPGPPAPAPPSAGPEGAP